MVAIRGHGRATVRATRAVCSLHVGTSSVTVFLLWCVAAHTGWLRSGRLMNLKGKSLRTGKSWLARMPSSRPRRNGLCWPLALAVPCCCAVLCCTTSSMTTGSACWFSCPNNMHTSRPQHCTHPTDKYRCLPTPPVATLVLH